MGLEMTRLSGEAIQQHRIRKVKMFGGGGRENSIEVLQNAGLFGPRMTGGGWAPPAPAGVLIGPPPERYDPVPINISSPPGPASR